MSATPLTDAIRERIPEPGAIQELLSLCGDLEAAKNKAVAALKALSENIGTFYSGDWDEIGECAVCHEITTDEHSKDCELRQALELLKELEGVKP